jgi:hypothetical protein
VISGLFYLLSCQQARPDARVFAANGSLSSVRRNCKVDLPKFTPPTLPLDIPHGDSSLGIWEVREECYYHGNENGITWVLFINPRIFVYDGRYVTTSYFVIWRNTVAKWHSRDDIYKLRAKWNGDTLLYRTPYKSWEKLAVYNKGVFTTDYISTDTVYTIIFKKIRADEVKEADRPFLRHRKAFNYS